MWYFRDFGCGPVEFDRCDLRSSAPAQICIAKHPDRRIDILPFLSPKLELDLPGIQDLGQKSMYCQPSHLWNESMFCFTTLDSSFFLGLMRMHFAFSGDSCWLICGVSDHRSELWVHVAPTKGVSSIPALSDLNDIELQSPYTISNLRRKLKGTSIFNPSTPGSCRITLNNGVKFVLTASATTTNSYPLCMGLTSHGVVRVAAERVPWAPELRF